MALLEGVSFPFLLEEGESSLVSCAAHLKKTPGHFWLTDRRVVWAQDPKANSADVSIGMDRIHCNSFVFWYVLSCAQQRQNSTNGQQAETGQQSICRQGEICAALCSHYQ